MLDSKCYELANAGPGAKGWEENGAAAASGLAHSARLAAASGDAKLGFAVDTRDIVAVEQER